MISENTAYNRLVQLIKDRHHGAISNHEAHRLARNLMGFCELAIKINTNAYQESLDNQLKYSNLPTILCDAAKELDNSTDNKKTRGDCS